MAYLTSYFIKSNITYPIAEARVALDDPGLSEQQFQRAIYLMVTIEMMYNIQPDMFGVRMIRDAQWYDWDATSPAENVNWTDTIVYDDNYIVCHYVRPPMDKLTVT